MSEDYLEEWTRSFHHVGSGDPTQLVRLGSKRICPLCLLTGPVIHIFYIYFWVLISGISKLNYFCILMPHIDTLLSTRQLGWLFVTLIDSNGGASVCLQRQQCFSVGLLYSSCLVTQMSHSTILNWVTRVGRVPVLTHGASVHPAPQCCQWAFCPCPLWSEDLPSTPTLLKALTNTFNKCWTFFPPQTCAFYIKLKGSCTLFLLSKILFRLSVFLPKMTG